MNRNLLILVLAPLLMSCGGEVKRLQGDIKRLERSLADLRSIQAEHTSVVAGVRADLRSISGRVEEIEYAQGGRGNTSNIGGGYPQQGSRQATNIPLPAIVPERLLEVDEVYAKRLPQEAGQPLSEGFGLIRAGDFRGAISSFNRSLESSVGRDWSAVTLFWLGLCYEALGETERALGAYNDISSTFPKHRRVPQALLHQASAFRSLGDKGAAKLTYQKLIAEFPRSNEASTAKQKLRGL